MPLAYSSNDPNADFTFELSFRPIFSISGSILDGISASAAIYVDVPKFDVNVSQAMHVQRNCEPADPSTPDDEIFHNLTHVVPTLSYDWGVNATEVGGESWTIGNETVLATACLDYLPSATAQGPVPGNAKSDATPRWTQTVPTRLLVLLVMSVLFRGL